jgi:parvulin-like peptidyl-prolyl isomerase
VRSQSRSVGLLVALVALVVTACGSVTGSTAVSVGDVDYSQDALKDDLRASIVDGTADAIATNQWLNEWIFFTTVELELESRGIVPSADQVDSATAALVARNPEFDADGPGAQIRISQESVRVAALEWAEEQYPNPEPADIGEFVPDILCSNHILVETEDQAADVLARLDAGELFADLAVELSIDTGSGALGGELGCYPEGSLVPEFENAGYAAGDGEVIGPVQTQFGFHVIEVLSAGPATQEEHPELDPSELEGMVASGVAQVQAQVQAAAQAEVDALRSELLDGVLADAQAAYADRVSVASEYGTWDPDRYVILPPGAPAGDPAGTG